MYKYTCLACRVNFCVVCYQQMADDEPGDLEPGGGQGSTEAPAQGSTHNQTAQPFDEGWENARMEARTRVSSSAQPILPTRECATVVTTPLRELPNPTGNRGNDEATAIGDPASQEDHIPTPITTEAIANRRPIDAKVPTKAKNMVGPIFSMKAATFML